VEKVLDIAGIDPVKLMKLREDDPASFNDIAEMLKKVHY
jgi:DNA-binding Lrp family transcriptional regulator